MSSLRQFIIGTWIVLFTAIAAFCEPPELPVGLWLKIKWPSTSLTRINWEAMSSLPMTQRIMEIEDVNDMRKIEVIGPIARAIKILPSLNSEIREAWLEDENGTIWLSTNLDAEELALRFTAADWISIPNKPGFFAQPLNPQEDSVYFDLINNLEDYPDSNQDDFTIIACRKKWRVGIGEGGWLTVDSPYRDVTSSCCLYKPSDEELDETVTFPFEALISGSHNALIVMAVNIPETEDRDASTNHDNNESLPTLEFQLKQLKKLPEASIIGAIGDILMIATEIDGGIAVDIAAQRPPNVVGNRTIQIYETALMAARLFVSWAGPELARELGDTTINLRSDKIEASVVLSHASLYDATDFVVERFNEMSELKSRIRDMRAIQSER